jgi:hypothetical protein
VCDPRYRGAWAQATPIGPLPYWVSLTQWCQSGLGRLGRHDAPLANGPLARLFWGVLDALDYWVMQARQSVVDAVFGRPGMPSMSPSPARRYSEKPPLAYFVL